MNKKEIKFWYWLFWLAVTIIAIWIIIKLLGLIKTPLIFEILPTISGFIALISIGILLGNNFQKTSFAIERIHKIENRQDKMASGLISLEKNLDIMKKDITIIKTDIRDIKERLGK